MKIGLVILHANPAQGGAERYTIDIAQSLSDRGHSVTLIASSFADELPARLARVRLPLSGATKTAQYIRFLDQLDAHLKQQDYDVVHAMLPVQRCDVYHPHAGLAAAAVESGHEKHAGLKRAFARVFNRLNPKRRKFAAVERALLESPRRPLTICLSDYIQKAVRKYYTLDDAHLVTLFNAVDLMRFDPSANLEARPAMRGKLGLADNDVAALIIAQDFERKGLREAILALSRVDDSRLRLIVVGKQDPSVYRHLARTLRLADRVFFAGATSDVYSFYAAADCFVLPTRHDPCSLVVLEALAMGLPVISTRQNGATEIMQQGEDGFILEHADQIPELASALQALCNTPLRQRMRETCLARRERLSFDRHMERLLSIYQQAMERKRRSP